jgi:hypothetical protein
MVIVPFILGVAIITIVTKSTLNPLGYLEAIGVIFISDFFFLALTLMLGTFFDSRGPVIGIPLGILFMQQNLIGFLPALRYVLPWNLVVPIGNTNPLAISFLLKTPLPQDQLITLAVIVVESILFVLIALWRFNREEF